MVNDGRSVNTTIPIAGTFTGAAHEYRVDWNSNTATFFVDGVQKAANAFRPLVQLRSVLLDPTNDATPLAVSWVRAGTYAASTTYVSPVIDAGADGRLGHADPRRGGADRHHRDDPGPVRAECDARRVVDGLVDGVGDDRTASPGRRGTCSTR